MDTEEELMETVDLSDSEELGQEIDEDEVLISSDDEDDSADKAIVSELRAKLSENPYDYVTHVALISKLQKMGELDDLRAAREDMSSKYPLSPDLWLPWIKEESNLATTDEQKAKVNELCERAVKDYLSVEVWLEYLQISIGNMSSDEEATKKIRDLAERALMAVGLHVAKGVFIWEAYREFEQVLLAMIDPTNTNETKEQLDRIGNLFKRQLACPLLDMEKTLEEYECWRSQEGKDSLVDDAIVQSGYQRASAKLKEISAYEEKIMSSEDAALLDAYKMYLNYEKKHGDPGRVCILYERALAELSLEASVWIDYLDYLESNKLEVSLESNYQRAVKNVPWNAKIWQKWLRYSERSGKPVNEMQGVFESALGNSFSSAEEYRSLWITYLEYLRRGIDRDSKEEDKRMEIIRNTFNKACEFLAKYFGLEGDPTCVLLQFWARTEAIHAGNMEKARSLWTDILSQGHSSSASSWLEYISLERCYGDTKHLRKLFPKALAAVKDWPESIANAWIDFERDEGTLEQTEICEAKTSERLAKVAEERLKAQASTVVEAKVVVKKAQKRKVEDTGRWQKLGASPSKIGRTETSKKSLIRESGANVDKTAEASSSDRKNVEQKDEKMETDNQQEVDHKITVFVSNLDYTATEDEVKEALQPAGPIDFVRMIRDYKGRSKGFCYVQLTCPENVELALKLDRTPIKGRPMFVSRCEPDKTSRHKNFKYSSTLEKNKLFVKGLPLTTTKEELEELFKVHGELMEVRLVTYRNGHSKGLAYVDFKDKNDAAKALIATDGMKIGDKVINVAISQPPERKKTTDGDDSSQVKSLGGTSSSRTVFGMPRTLLSMVPRNVKTAKNGDPGNGMSQPLSNQDFRQMMLDKGRK